MTTAKIEESLPLSPTIPSGGVRQPEWEHRAAAHFEQNTSPHLRARVRTLLADGASLTLACDNHYYHDPPYPQIS